MRRKWLTVACALSLTVALSAAEPVTAAPKVDDPHASLRVFVGDLTPAQVERLRGLGVDDVATAAGTAGKVKVEVILSARQAIM